LPVLHHDEILRNAALAEIEYYFLASQNSFFGCSGSPTSACDRES